MENNIISFGKYKGQPVEILASDAEYTKWLLAQSWFKEKNINLYTIVINNFRDPVDTPEHNKMQIKFLDINYRLKFALFVNQQFFKYNSEEINNSIFKELTSNKYAKEIAFILRNPNNYHGIKNKHLLSFNEPNFEIVDVSFRVKYGTEISYSYVNRDRKNHYYNEKMGETLKLFNEEAFQIEIKPTVSDDFPSILRQMKASMPIKAKLNSILFLKEYTGIGATKEEFCNYFKSQNYLVVFEKEIDNINIPNFDTELMAEQYLKDKITEILK